MTDDQDGFPWPPTLFGPERLQEASEEAVERQQELFEQWLSTMQAGASTGTNGLSGIDALSTGTATFKSRVQSGGRISIPDAEREALDIEEGDIVQTIVVPVKRNRDSSNND